VSLYEDVTGVYCAVSATRIIGPIFTWDHKFTPAFYTHFDTIP